MTRFILLASILLSLTACRDLFERPINTIEGRLLQNCDGLPVSNELLVLSMDGFWGRTNICDSTVTDANGFFKFEFKGAASVIEFDGEAVLSLDSEYIPEGDIGNLFVENRGTIRFTLKVSDPKTTADTLQIQSRDQLLKIAGPFNDGDTHMMENIDITSDFDFGFGNCFSDSTCTFCTPWSISSAIKQDKPVSEWTVSNVGLCGCGRVNELEIKIE